MIDLLEPLEYYNKEFKNKFKDKAVEYFDKLAKNSNIDKEANKKQVGLYKSKLGEVAAAQKEVQKKKNLINFMIFLIIFGAFLILLGAFNFKKENTIFPIVAVILGVVLIVIGIIVWVKTKPKLSAAIEFRDKKQAEADKILEVCYAQMAELNSLFDYGVANEIINDCLDIITMDKIFKPERFTLLNQRYGFQENYNKNRSILMCQSGEILGNPFILYKELEMIMGTQDYTGSITIHWTTTSTDAKGHLTTHHHTETLYATVTKPKPFYYRTTRLAYGNEAAPDLSFSRAPNKFSTYDEKKLRKELNKFENKLDKMVQKDINSNDGSQFTRLHNTEFEAMFNALDRDNETQFRLLFTALAQKNEIAFLKSKEFFGDDYKFLKRKKVNVITSTHSQIFDYFVNPTFYQTYDYEETRKRFVEYNCDYLKNFYADMIPLLSIPLYQQTKTLDYIYDNSYPSNVTMFETEVMANQFDSHLLEPKGCATEIIIKPNFLVKKESVDGVMLTSYGFKGTDMVDYIEKMGGDGHMHSIPVHWVKYDPIATQNYMALGETNMSKKEFQNEKTIEKNSSIIIKDGILAKICSLQKDLDNAINTIQNYIKIKK